MSDVTLTANQSAYVLSSSGIYLYNQATVTGVGYGVQVTGMADYVSNYGGIYGGAGDQGGVGVIFSVTGGLYNAPVGVIGGGAGTSGSETVSGDGGNGVVFAFGAVATVFNAGTILGGSGGFSATDATSVIQGGSGGVGVYLQSGGTLINGNRFSASTISGGAGGQGGYAGSSGGYGGTGVAAAGATVVNYGTIVGGSGGSNFVDGTNGAGGAGVSIAGGVVYNYFLISGGAGGTGRYGAAGGAGGAGAAVSGGAFYNSFFVAGGDGGVGVGGYGGAGGDGVVVMDSGTVGNSGEIFGGSAGLGTNALGGLVGPSGGAGVVFTDGGTLFNDGGIIGGSAYTYGTPGVGVTAGSNTTVFNAGAIYAGDTYSGGMFGPGSVDSVDFSGSDDRLVIFPGASFGGAVVVNAAGSNVLELDARSPAYFYPAGTIGGIGSQYSGFAQITVDSATYWTLAGNNTLASGVTFVDSGVLTNTGSLGGTGVTLNGGVLINAAGATIVSSGIGVASYNAAATVVNAGTIIGSGDAVSLASGYLNRVVLYPGAVFSGVVDGGNALGAAYDSTLELAAGGTYGTLTGLGTQYIDFAQVVVDIGAVWTVTAPGTGAIGTTFTLYGTLTNAGSLGPTVYVEYGGLLTNIAGSTIANAATSATGPVVADGATVINDGLIVNAATSGLAPGVYLQGTAALTNDVTGTIQGGWGVGSEYGSLSTISNAGTIVGTAAYGYGIGLQNTGSVDNSGLIEATDPSGIGIQMKAGGTIGNEAGGIILGGTTAIILAGGYGTVTNSGSIGGSDRVIYLESGGSVTNGATGTIGGGGFGVVIAGASGTVDNSGGIGGLTTTVYLTDGGSVTNEVTGTIGGGEFGLAGNGGQVTIVNAGTIAGSYSGIYLLGGGSVTNQSGGTIAGGVTFAYGTPALLAIDPGAVFSGAIEGGNGPGAASGSTLELASGSAIGVLSGLGSTYTGFQQIVVDSGAQWEFDGANTVAYGVTLSVDAATVTSTGTLTNYGTIVLDPSTMVVAGLVGTGSVTIGAGSTLEVTGSIASTETIVFQGSGGYLQLDDPSDAQGAVAGFAGGDSIDLAGVAPGSVTFSGGDVTFPGGSFALSDPGYMPAAADDMSGGALITPCFAAGTRIETAGGMVAVESLRVGMLVRVDGGGVLVVRWIGHRSVDLTGHPWPERVLPVRIRAGAFAEGVPWRDLRLSPDHAVLVDGVLIPIKLLRNGTSIVREADCRRVTYYHVELERHAVLSAEGLAAESYLDTGNRGMFANGGAPVVLHADFGNDQARRVAESCAPLVTDAAGVRPVWQALADRAAGLGWRLPEAADTTDDADLCIMVGRRRIRPVCRDGGRYSFVLPPIDAPVRLVSRAVIPSEETPWVDDPRRLGVLVERFVHVSGGSMRAIPMDYPGFSDGWWAVEYDRGRWHRWTDGSALLPLTAAGPTMLHVDLACTLRYPAETVAVRQARAA